MVEIFCMKSGEQIYEVKSLNRFQKDVSTNFSIELVLALYKFRDYWGGVKTP